MKHPMAVTASRLFLAGLNPVAPLRQLTARRELLWQFTKRHFEQRHKGSYLGGVWALLNPLLMLGLYYVVFGKIISKVPAKESADFALNLLVGLTVFHFLAEVIGQSPTLIVANPNLVKKVVFPVEILPIANLGASLVNFGVSLTLVVIGQALFGSQGLSVTILWLPVLLIPIILMGAGAAWFLAAAGVFFRDISQTTQFASMVLMYVSAVFFSVQSIQQGPGWIWEILRLNPVLEAIRLCRESMLLHQDMNLPVLGWLYLASLLAFVFGHGCFTALRPSFSDVL
jgi:lipopolysaccharide transport system permease protein